jgi:hypothetical protein
MRYSDDELIGANYLYMFTEASLFQPFFNGPEPIKYLHAILRFKHDVPIELKQIGGKKVEVGEELEKNMVFWINPSTEQRLLAIRSSTAPRSTFKIYIFDKNKLIRTDETFTQALPEKPIPAKDSRKSIVNPLAITIYYMERKSRIYVIKRNEAIAAQRSLQALSTIPSELKQGLLNFLASRKMVSPATNINDIPTPNKTAEWDLVTMGLGLTPDGYVNWSRVTDATKFSQEAINSFSPEDKKGMTAPGLYVKDKHTNFWYGPFANQQEATSAVGGKLRKQAEVNSAYMRNFVAAWNNTNQLAVSTINKLMNQMYGEIVKDRIGVNLTDIKDAISDKIDDVDTFSDEEMTKLVTDYRRYRKSVNKALIITNEDVFSFCKAYKNDIKGLKIMTAPQDTVPFDHSLSEEEIKNFIKNFTTWYLRKIPTKITSDVTIDKVLGMI